MAWKFVTPTVKETPAGFGWLFWRYPIDRSDTYLVTGTTVTHVRTPGVEQTTDADYCYLGGHEYIISDTEKTILTNAGYGPYITAV